MGDGDYLLDNNAKATSVLSLKLTHIAGGVDLDGPSPSKATSPAGSAGSVTPCSPVHSPFHSHSRTPTKGGGGRSQSSSPSSLFSWGTQPESPNTSYPDEGCGGSSASEDDSESNNEGEAGSDDRASDSGSDSDDESSSSGESGSEEASDNEGTQQDGSDNKGEGSSSETEESGTGGSSIPFESDHAESPPKVSPPAKKAPEVNLNTSQMLSLPDLDSKDLEEEQTCDHADPCKKVKSSDQLGLLLDYMMSHGVFKPKKTSEYDLCRFCQVGLSGDLPEFPLPHAPATCEQVSSLLLKARVLVV